MFGHAAIGNKSHGESVVIFSLAVDLRSPSVISLKIEIAFAVDGDKTRLPIAEVLLYATASNLARPKKQREWTLHNSVLLPPFFTEAVILHGESDAGKIVNIFTRSIMEWAKEGENASEADDDNDEESVITIEAEDENTEKLGKAKQATAGR